MNELKSYYHSHSYNAGSTVEQVFLEKSGYKALYAPAEKIKSIVVDNFPMLGQLTSLRFLEWVQKNPGGVIALPTGKTPEFFIRWTEYFLKNWKKKPVRSKLDGYGIDRKNFPDLGSLFFVQIDEFYPINPRYQNSFYYYIRKFYLDAFGLDRKKALLMDLSRAGIPPSLTIRDVFPGDRVDLTLRLRQAKNHQEETQQKAIRAVDCFCMEYEEKIRSLGGIGFFLGGIGPDGHIGFNIRGSDHHSTTRLMGVNYETAAASAPDLGGIEVSRNRLVVTMGLATITGRRDCAAVIMAAGEAKAAIVAASIENERGLLYPASALQVLPHARFFLTRGAASELSERKLVCLKRAPRIGENEIRTHLLDYCVRNRRRLESLTESELKKDRFMKYVTGRARRKVPEMKKLVRNTVLKNIEAGMRDIRNSTILHTSPHHDDEMLGYLPYIVHLVREPSNRHYFSYMTSGFTAVTNLYMQKLLENLEAFLPTPRFQFLFRDNYFRPSYPHARSDDVYMFLDGLSLIDRHTQDEALARRMLRILMEIYKDRKIGLYKNRIRELLQYFRTRYPGQKDIPPVQKMKGMVREFESELVWGYFGFDVSSMIHARLGFYTGDIFTPAPAFSTDVMPVLRIIRRTKPDIVTVALDPEGSGPDTHYKVLQAISEALRIYQKETRSSSVRVWGYRNIWYRFHPAEANLYIPVSLNSFSILNHAFLNCFGSQREASFPSWEHDGPFSGLAQKIMVRQYAMIKACLGEGFFYNNPHPRLRAARGLVFLKEMSLEEFYSHSEELKKLQEEDKGIRKGRG